MESEDTFMIAIVAGLVAAMMVICTKKGLKTKAQKIIDIGKTTGCYVVAPRVAYKCYGVGDRLNDFHGTKYTSELNRTITSYAEYRYTAGGREYRYWKFFRGYADAPKEYTVYWDPAHPEKAVADKSDIMGFEYSFFCLLPFLVFLLVMVCFGLVGFVSEFVANGGIM